MRFTIPSESLGISQDFSDFLGISRNLSRLLSTGNPRDRERIGRNCERKPVISERIVESIGNNIFCYKKKQIRLREKS